MVRIESPAAWSIGALLPLLSARRDLGFVPESWALYSPPPRPTVAHRL